VLADRRRSLGEDHTRMICQLHRLLAELIPGGAKKALSAAQARALLARVRPRGAGRAGPAPGRRRAGQRPGTRSPAQEGRGQGADRGAEGRRHHADRPGRDRPVRRGPAPGRGRRHRPVPQPGALRLLERDRADRRVLRRSCPPPAVPGREPAGQPRPAHHGRGLAPPRHPGPRLLRPQGRRRQDPDGSHALPQTPPVRRGVPADESRCPRRADGPGRTHGGGYWLQRGRLGPHRRHFGQVTSRTRQP
jgi:hypothetical protein